MSDIQDYEQGIEIAKTLIEQRQMVLKLSENREFRVLIHQNFMIDETVRLMGISADPNLPEKERADCINMAQAPGHLKRFLSLIVQKGYQAEQELPQLEAALDELRSVEMSDDA